MKTNFKNYLAKKKAQDIIDKFAKKHEGTKIILYGVDLFTGDLFRNYDLSKLNIIGVCDKSFEQNSNSNFYDYPKIQIQKLLDENFDILLITLFDDTEAKSFLKKELLKDKAYNFKIKTLVKMNIFEYIHALINGDI